MLRMSFGLSSIAFATIDTGSEVSRKMSRREGKHLDAVTEQVDLISIHTYPVWEYKTIYEALASTEENNVSVAERYPNKQVIITEAGWATASNGRGVPSESVGEFYQKRQV